MNLNTIRLFEETFFSIDASSFIELMVLIIFLVSMSFFTKHWLSKKYLFEREKKELKRQIFQNLDILLLFSIITLVTLYFDFDFIVFDNHSILLKISTLLIAIIVIMGARAVDLIFYKLLLKEYALRREQSIKTKADKDLILRDDQEWQGRLSITFRYFIYVVCAIIMVKVFNIDYHLFDFEQNGRIIPFRISKILFSALIFISARLLAWVLSYFVLKFYFKKHDLNIGSQYAINQILIYILYVIAIILAIENLGLQMTVIWGGAAALLVGLGLGLQQTFNDFLSGILLLFERTVNVGDILEVDDVAGTIETIGLRTSTLKTYDNRSMVVPNSKLVVNSVINQSYSDSKVRFFVKVGVAYGSDTTLVKELLIKAAEKSQNVLKTPKPFVRFTDFGESSLAFEVHFWTKDLIFVEDTKSTLRFHIDELFRKNNIQIPFPQQDVWIRSRNED